MRTFYDANDPEDTAIANALQDQLGVEGGGSGPLDVPDWNLEQMMTARDALNTLAKLGISNENALGAKDEVDPIKHHGSEGTAGAQHASQERLSQRESALRSRGQNDAVGRSPMLRS